MQEAALRRAGPFKPLRTTTAGLSGEFPRDLLLPVHLALGVEQTFLCDINYVVMLLW